MNLITFRQAEQYPASTSNQQLSRLSRKKNPLPFFVSDGLRTWIDADDPSWLEYLEKRQQKILGKAPNSPPPVNIKEAARTLAELQREKLRRDVQSLDLKNAMGREKLERDSRDLIDFDLAKFAFDTYMDSAEAAADQGTENLRPKLRELLKQAIVSGDAEQVATQITKSIVKKNEKAIRTAKTETRTAIERRRDEREASDG